MAGLHALQKILAAHAQPKRTAVTPGEYLQLVPDVFAFGISYNAEEANRFEANLAELGVKEFPLKDRIFAFQDHGGPAPSPAFAAGQKRWREVIRSRGIPVTDPGAGISHLIMTEQGVVGPGMVVALRDSHTPTMGAVGAFTASVAGGLLSLFALGRYWLDVPKVSLVNIEGTLRKGVYGRDVALHVNGRLGQRGALGNAVEFAGSYVSDLGMDIRFTLCNMGTEIGAMASYVQPDKITLDWVKPRARKPYTVYETDAGYQYDRVDEFDVSALEPQVAAPHAPDNVKPLAEVEGTHINQAYLGSCASGRLEDIAAAAAVVKGRKVHPDVRFIVTPGSREVLNAAIRLGYIEILNDANAIVTNANCGACPGLHGGVLAPGDVAIACNTRNFEGRMGPNASIYLASPASVAASALEGRITSPLKYPMKITGAVWKFPQDDINTDQIRRKNYAHLPLKEQALHCLETLDPGFAARVKPGDLIVGGRNFGCGSSTPAHAALIELGIAAIVAESFSRIFFRSSISAGLLVNPCAGILELVSTGDRIELDAVAGRITNLTTGRSLAGDPLPDFLREMVELGGEKAYIKAQLAASRHEG